MYMYMFIVKNIYIFYVFFALSALSLAGITIQTKKLDEHFILKAQVIFSFLYFYGFMYRHY